MRPMPNPESLRKFLSEAEMAEAVARAGAVARMSRLDLVRSAFAPLVRAIRRRLAYWSGSIRSGSLSNPG